MRGTWFDAEAFAEKLNAILVYARNQVDPATNQGYFPLGYNMSHELKAEADYLRKALIYMGLIKMVDNTRRKGLRHWWVCPEGEVTPADAQRYRDAQRALRNQ